jgi:hypothetical protein
MRKDLEPVALNEFQGWQEFPPNIQNELQSSIRIALIALFYQDILLSVKKVG